MATVTQVGTHTEFVGDYIALNPARTHMLIADDSGVSLYTYPDMVNVNGPDAYHVVAAPNCFIFGVTCDGDGNWYYAEAFDDNVTAEDRIKTFPGTSTTVSTWATRPAARGEGYWHRPVWSPQESCIYTTAVTPDRAATSTDAAKLWRVTTAGFVDLHDIGDFDLTAPNVDADPLAPNVDADGKVWWHQRSRTDSNARIIARYDPATDTIAEYGDGDTTSYPVSGIGTPDGRAVPSGVDGAVQWVEATFNGTAVVVAEQSDLEAQGVNFGPAWASLNGCVAVLVESGDGSVWEINWCPAAGGWRVGSVGFG